MSDFLKEIKDPAKQIVKMYLTQGQFCFFPALMGLITFYLANYWWLLLRYETIIYSILAVLTFTYIYSLACVGELAILLFKFIRLRPCPHVGNIIQIINFTLDIFKAVLRSFS